MVGSGCVEHEPSRFEVVEHATEHLVEAPGNPDEVALGYLDDHLTLGATCSRHEILIGPHAAELRVRHGDATRVRDQSPHAFVLRGLLPHQLRVGGIVGIVVASPLPRDLLGRQGRSRQPAHRVVGTVVKLQPLSKIRWKHAAHGGFEGGDVGRIRTKASIRAINPRIDAEATSECAGATPRFTPPRR